MSIYAWTEGNSDYVHVVISHVTLSLLWKLVPASILAHCYGRVVPISRILSVVGGHAWTDGNHHMCSHLILCVPYCARHSRHSAHPTSAKMAGAALKMVIGSVGNDHATTKKWRRQVRLWRLKKLTKQSAPCYRVPVLTFNAWNSTYSSVNAQDVVIFRKYWTESPKAMDAVLYTLLSNATSWMPLKFSLGVVQMLIPEGYKGKLL